MFKRWLQNIKSWFSDLFHGNLTFGYGSKDWQGKSSWEELHDKGSVMLNQSQSNNELTASPYSDSQTVNDLYSQYNAVGANAFNSLVNKYSEAGLTGQQAALNEMQMDNQRRQYAFLVQGMNEAGLNPALMYESGAQTAPSAPAPTQGASMSELIQLMLADKQARLLKSEADNKDADTDKKKAETENMKLVNQYYPQVTKTQIDKMLTEMGLTDAQIEETFANVNSTNLDVELKRIEKVIKQAQADESSAYYKATRELEEAKTERERVEKERLVVQKAMDLLEKEYMEHTNTKMGPSTVVSLAAALGTLFSNFHIDSEDFVSEFNKRFNQLLDWINKPKKAPWVKD